MLKKLFLIIAGLSLIAGIVVLITLIPKLQARNRLINKFHTSIRQDKIGEAYALLCKDPPPEDLDSFKAFAEAYKQITADKLTSMNEGKFTHLQPSDIEQGKKQIAKIADDRHVGHGTLAATSNGAELFFRGTRRARWTVSSLLHRLLTFA